jgi:hypothetical protein
VRRGGWIEQMIGESKGYGIRERRAIGADVPHARERDARDGRGWERLTTMLDAVGTGVRYAPDDAFLIRSGRRMCKYGGIAEQPSRRGRRRSSSA